MKIDQEKAKKKEESYNGIIQMLQKQAEENAKEGKKVERNDFINESPNEKIDELTSKLKQSNELVEEQKEQLLRQELKIEKIILDNKIMIQEKDDIITEERMNIRHKESELRGAKSALERSREDIGFRVQEAVDRA